MIVYRLESMISGNGPFFTPSVSTAIMETINLDTHPTPSDDGLAKWTDIPYKAVSAFGCPSMRELRRWFVTTVTKRQRMLALDDEWETLEDSDKYVREHNSVMCESLSTKKFRLIVYDVPDGSFQVGVSGIQVAFRRDKATVVDNLPVDILFAGAKMRRS